jgi:3-oxoadipate enol-lactonase
MFITVNGVRLYYEQEGQGSDLILIHGLGMSLRDWDAHMPDLAKHHRVLRIDVRGFGQSDKPPGPYSPQLFASDVAGIARACHITRAHVAGISMGGVITQRLVFDFPELVQSMTLISTSSEVNTQAQAAWEKLANGVERQGFTAADGMADRLHAASFTKAYPERVQHRQRLTAANDPRAFAAAARAVSAFNWTADLERVQVPTLILQGLEDVLTPPGGGVKMSRALSHSRLLMLPECGHFVPDEKPEIFTNALLAFLAGVDLFSQMLACGVLTDRASI